MSTPPVLQDFQHVNRRVQIHIDLDPINPLEAFDTAVTLAYWGNRYTFGNKHIQRQTKKELLESQQHDPILAILPLYAYVHSEVSVSTSPYSCHWDSGQAGWAYITQSGSDLIGYQGYSKDQLEEVIQAEVKFFDAYLNGRVYGFQILGLNGDVLDSCWGFLDDLEGCIYDAKLAAESTSDPCIEKMAEELAERATYAGVITYE